MCENGCQTEDSGDIEPQQQLATIAPAPVPETMPSLITTPPTVQSAARERVSVASIVFCVKSIDSLLQRHAGSGITKDSLFRDNVAKMAESTEEVLQKIMQTREQQPVSTFKAVQCVTNTECLQKSSLCL